MKQSLVPYPVKLKIKNKAKKRKISLSTSNNRDLLLKENSLQVSMDHGNSFGSAINVTSQVTPGPFQSRFATLGQAPLTGVKFRNTYHSTFGVNDHF